MKIGASLSGKRRRLVSAFRQVWARQEMATETEKQMIHVLRSGFVINELAEYTSYDVKTALCTFAKPPEKGHGWRCPPRCPCWPQSAELG